MQQQLPLQNTLVGWLPELSPQNCVASCLLLVQQWHDANTKFGHQQHLVMQGDARDKPGSALRQHSRCEMRLAQCMVQQPIQLHGEATPRSQPKLTTLAACLKCWPGDQPPLPTSGKISRPCMHRAPRCCWCCSSGTELLCCLHHLLRPASPPPWLQAAE